MNILKKSFISFLSLSDKFTTINKFRHFLLTSLSVADQNLGYSYVLSVSKYLKTPIYRKTLKLLSPDLRVLAGPFKGMQYTRDTGNQTVFMSRILGTYEMEVYDILLDVSDGDYLDIVNLGSAEGYYAVGMAMRLPSSTIHAYDTAEEARTLLEEIAIKNGVQDRIISKILCDSQEISNLKIRGKGLMISDCEGFEYELFTGDFWKVASNYDILLEVHDNGFDALKLLNTLFEKTHIGQFIKSREILSSDFKFTNTKLNEQQKKLVLCERLPRAIGWLWLKAKPLEALENIESEMACVQ